MTTLVLFCVLGLGGGAMIAGLALAVVLTHRGSGVINLSAGAVAMVAAYGDWALASGYVGVALPAPLAALGGVLLAVALAVLCEIKVFRPLRHASPLAGLTASLGILLTAQALVVIVFGTGPKPQPSLLPDGVVPVAGISVPVNRFLIAALVVAAALALREVYRRTRFGLATRAASENELAAMYVGLDPQRLALVNAVAAAVTAAVLGVLAAPLMQLDSVSLPLQVVPALGAALLARFTSFGIACAAGLLIGIAQSLVYFASTQPWFPTDHGTAMPGVQQVLVLLVVVAALFWRGAGLPTRGDVLDRSLPPVPVPHDLVRALAPWTAAAAVLLVVAPYGIRQALITSLIGAVIVLSYVVITGYVGQLSVVQLALSGVSGFALSHLATGLGLGFPFAPLLAIALTTGLGVAIAFCALRVRGVSLAVVTLAAAVALEQFGFANSTWGGGSGGSPVPAPTLFGLDLGPDNAFRGLLGGKPSPVFGLVVLVVTVGLGAYVANLRRTTFGRRMLAVRADERAAAAAGVDVRGVKLLAFGLSSFIAAVAGVLYGYNFGSVSATRFGALTALGLIAFAYIGGVTMVSGAVTAGLMATEGLFPYLMQTYLGLSGTWSLLIGGFALIATLLANPEGIAGAGYRKRQERLSRKEAGPAPSEVEIGVAG